MGKKKPPTKLERQHMAKVASIGCIACRKIGFYDTPAEIHHIRSGMGMGQRNSHMKVIPLCPFITGQVAMETPSMLAKKNGRGVSGVSGICWKKPKN